MHFIKETQFGCNVLWESQVQKPGLHVSQRVLLESGQAFASATLIRFYMHAALLTKGPHCISHNKMVDSSGSMHTIMTLVCALLACTNLSMLS